MSPREQCLFCGERASQWHHPTQQKWDRPITVPLCFNDHRLVEDDWPTVGYPADRPRPKSLLHLVAMGCVRWGMLVGRLAAAGVLATLTGPLARWLAQTGQQLRAVIAALDAAYGVGWWTLRGIALD